jgi:diguanylate cyclase (GGDEF)-like protein
MIIITEASEQIMETICERLRSKIEATHFKSGLDEMRLTSSLGYSLSKPGERTPSKAVVRAADKALYQSKEQGRNRIFGYLQKKNPEVFTD